jgi:hypothetical protein
MTSFHQADDKVIRLTIRQSAWWQMISWWSCLATLTT